MKKRGRPPDPKTPEQWQEAADMAEFYLLLESCRLYGLITGGPVVRSRRCVYVLEKAKARGVVPASHDTIIARYLPTWVGDNT